MRVVVSVKAVTVMKKMNKDDNLSYFDANFRSCNHITFNGLDEIKRLVFIFSLCDETFVDEIIIFENLF